MSDSLDNLATVVWLKLGWYAFVATEGVFGTFFYPFGFSRQGCLCALLADLKLNLEASLV